MFSVHTKPDESGPSSELKRPGNGMKREPSNADTLPVRHASVKRQEPRRQISNPVQRSTSHAQDQYKKANPTNSSRPDPRHDVPVKSPMTPRPEVQRAGTSYHTRYMEMLLNLDTVPRLHNIYASFLSWLMLAGFVTFPGTFTSIQDLTNNPEVEANETASTLLDHVKNVPLLIVAAICCGVGVAGMSWLAWRWRQNYVWLLNRLFLPGFMNGLAGLISSLVTVYTQQHGDWSVTAKVSAIVEGCCIGVSGVLFVLYNNLLLKRVKRKHGRELEQANRQEGFIEKAERMLNEPALEPGSVV